MREKHYKLCTTASITFAAVTITINIYINIIITYNNENFIKSNNLDTKGNLNKSWRHLFKNVKKKLAQLDAWARKVVQLIVDCERVSKLSEYIYIRNVCIVLINITFKLLINQSPNYWHFRNYLQAFIFSLTLSSLPFQS